MYHPIGPRAWSKIRRARCQLTIGAGDRHSYDGPNAVLRALSIQSVRPHRSRTEVRSDCDLRSDDGKIVLVTDGNYKSLDENSPSPATIANIDAALGFVLDIGIRRERALTLSGGFYVGHDLLRPQSSRVVSQSEFDGSLLDRIKRSLDECFQSGNGEKELNAIKTNHLITAYNDSRLLFPNFYNDSYLGLMRILDAIGNVWGADEFALSAAEVSPSLNEEIHRKISQVQAFSIKLEAAADVFAVRLSNAKKNSENEEKMMALEQSGQLIFSCFYSAYRYRNKFVHHGLPFPSTVKENWDPGNDSGMSYLSAAVGLSLPRRYSRQGLKSEDLIDIHAGVGNSEEVAAFKDRYFKLIPSWHFLKRVARQSLLNRIEQLASASPHRMGGA